ncbi:MAG: aldehyde dehydrogenase, partial [Acidimicrobiales bacterium]|nr:aldehyde dehydrogenase [Acidimicrobiales bacterium]
MTSAPGERGLLIGGSWVDGSGAGYEVVNPATEAVVGVAPESGPDDARAAAAAAAEAFPAWSRTAPEERAALLDRVADLLEARMGDLVPLVQAETGATLAVTTSLQIPQAITRFRRYARGALEPTRVPLPPGQQAATPLAAGGLISAVALRQPVGVVAAITSYNFPMTNMAGKICPALAMGNTVVVKPAPQDPLAVIELVAIMEEAGFPPGVVNVVNAPGAEAAEALVASPDVDMISFTGSTEVGRRIGEVAGRDMKRLLLELGGKGASIVFDDADLDAAVAGTGSTFAFHSGQICTAPTRVLAQRGVHDQVVERLGAMAAALKLGDPLEPDTIVGPVISAAHRERVQGHVEGGAAEGATLVTDAGGPLPDTGWYVAPALLADVTADMRVAQEEIFGPVVVVLAFEDEDEAVALANATPFGLYDYVWSADGNRAFTVASQLRSGNVGLNTLQRNHEA